MALPVQRQSNGLSHHEFEQETGGGSCTTTPPRYPASFPDHSTIRAFRDRLFKTGMTDGLWTDLFQ
ncbi:MAG TPA: hypothetical protein PLI31_09250 [Methanoregulaceae archaeon]|nr:hypothetical protein [Methanoregulaceae archaeon]